jgi:hypothetical protein
MSHLTRAEQQCTLSYAMSRYKYGTPITCEPSRFIDEIGHEFLEHASPYSKGPGKSLNARNPFTCQVEHVHQHLNPLLPACAN